jgi:integrase
MPVYKRGETWWVHVQIGRRRTRVSAGKGASRAQARQLEDRLRADVHAGRIGRVQRRTVSETLARWLDGEARGLKGWRNIAGKISAFQPFLRGRDISEAGDVADDARTAWLKKGLAPATINGRLRLYRRAMNLAFEPWKWLDRPVKIALVRGEVPRMVKLDEKQARRFIKACAGDQDLLVWVILQAHAGLRPGEPVKKGTRAAAGGRLELDSHTKTGRPRSVPLTREALQAAKLLPIRIGRDALRYRFERARDRAGMPWLQPRDLRRTFGSWIVQRSQNLKAAQDLLGNSSIQVTARHYAHLLDDHLVGAVATLPGLNATQLRHSRSPAKRPKVA